MPAVSHIVDELRATQVAQAEARNREAAGKIPDEAVVPLGSGRFAVQGCERYLVDLWGPRPYPSCSCKWWAIHNPNTLRAQGVAMRCKHILKVEDWAAVRTP